MEYEMGRSCKTNEKRNSYSNMVEEPNGKRLLGRSRCKGEDNARSDVSIKGPGLVKWIQILHGFNWF
jgi:hypothetical protein